MKLYRNAIILVVVLALLIGAYVVISKKKGNDTTGTATTTTTQNLNVLSLDSAKVNEVTIKNKDVLLNFTKNKEDWILKSPTGLKTNKDQILGVISGITGLTADKVIEEKATNLGQYGLDNAVTEIVINTSDNKTQTLELGNKTPTQDAYYLLDKGSNKVVTVSQYTADQFLDAKNQIRDKTLFTFEVDEKTGAVKDINGVAMDRSGKLLFTAKMGSESNWTLTAPFEANANGESMTPIIDAFTKITVSSFIEDNATDLEKYGLKTPAYALEVNTSKGKNRILLGTAKQGSTELYAMLDGSKDVFTIDPSALTFLDKPFKEIIEPFIYIVNIDTVTKIDVTMDEQIITSTIETDKDKGEVKADKDKDKFTINGKDASLKDANDDQPFRKYYQALIGITLDGIEMDAVPVGTPEITFTYTLNKAPGTMKVEFISKDKDYYYVVKNGKYSNILVQKTQFDKPEGVRDTYKILMDLINKKK